MKSCRSRRSATLSYMGVVLLVFVPQVVGGASAHYGDVVMNNFSGQRGMAPVVFPHSIHRVHFRCYVCHGELGFAMKAGANKIEKASIIQGQYCGACHNGKIAWGVASCERCHRGSPTP